MSHGIIDGSALDAIERRLAASAGEPEPLEDPAAEAQAALDSMAQPAPPSKPIREIGLVQEALKGIDSPWERERTTLRIDAVERAIEAYRAKAIEAVRSGGVAAIPGAEAVADEVLRAARMFKT